MKKRNILIPVLACCLTLTACTTSQEEVLQKEQSQEQKRIETQFANAEALGSIWGPNRGSRVKHINMSDNSYYTYTYDACSTYELYRIENGQQYMTIYKTPTNYYLQTNATGDVLCATIDVPADRTAEMEELTLNIRDKSDEGMSIFLNRKSYELSSESGNIVCTYFDANQTAMRCVLNRDIKVEVMTWQNQAANKSYEFQFIYMEDSVEELPAYISANVSLADVLAFHESIEKAIEE